MKNLRELLAEARAMGALLNAETDSLNTDLGTAETAIVELGLGVRGAVEIGPGESLEFGKYDDRWRLIYVRDNVQVPLVNAARRERLAGVAFLETLVLTMLKDSSIEKDRVLAARQAIARFVEDIKR